jgi:hypothetical protein
MKQRITVEQIKELSEEQRVKLLGGWKPRYFDIFWTGSAYDLKVVERVEDDGLIIAVDGYFCGSREFKDDYHFPLLSIGQMIEYLQNTGNDWTLHGSDWDSKDICDLLWKRVVHYL